MTSKELVTRTLEFDNPKRIPRQLWLLPWAQNNYPEQLKRIQNDYPDDIVYAPAVFEEQPKVSGKAFSVGKYVDEWGCVFEASQEGVLGEVKNPPILKWSDINKLRVPRECLTLKIDVVNDFCRQRDEFVLASCCPRPFERLQFLRGTENVMMDLAYEEKHLFDLLNILHQFFLEEMQVWAKTDVDGMMFMDDWGAQHSLLISPDQWRRVFKPLYKEYVDLAHSHGKKAFMHSDGYTIDIIGDLIEIGLDALNAQIFCMGIEDLGKKFKGKITFWGEIDRQNLLPSGTLEQIVEAVKSVYKNLYSNGGVIAQCEFGPGAKPENVYAVYKTWDELSL